MKPRPSCTTCNAPDLPVYCMCDEENEGNCYCPPCFEKHPCGLGDHNEGCATLVVDDGRNGE